MAERCSVVTRRCSEGRYADVFAGDEQWQAIRKVPRARSTTGRRRLDLHPEPALLRRHDDAAAAGQADIDRRARAGLLGDSITTDHISPAGSIAETARPASTC
jgi:aconitate hydratase